MDEHLQGLNAIKDKADVATIHARPTYPQSFKMANATDKDLLIAVHEMDEINMLSCQVAHSLFKIPKKIAKISSSTTLFVMNYLAIVIFRLMFSLIAMA